MKTINLIMQIWVVNIKDYEISNLSIISLLHLQFINPLYVNLLLIKYLNLNWEVDLYCLKKLEDRRKISRYFINSLQNIKFLGYNEQEIIGKTLSLKGIWAFFIKCKHWNVK